MNYEEKYNQAIESIKRIYEQADSFGKELMEKEFPELRESEDERIRKELIERFNWELKGAEEQDSAGCNRQKDIAMFKRGIAWLEKQGEHANFRNKIQVGDKVTRNEDGVLVNLSQLKRVAKPNDWKPSEEQLISLGRFIEGVYGCVDFTNIKSLYNNLKNL